MPLHQNQDGTWQWGKSGKKYKKKQDAIKQMKAIFASGYVEKKASFKSYTDVLGMIKEAANPGAFIQSVAKKPQWALSNIVTRPSQMSNDKYRDRYITWKLLGFDNPNTREKAVKDAYYNTLYLRESSNRPDMVRRNKKGKVFSAGISSMDQPALDQAKQLGAVPNNFKLIDLAKKKNWNTVKRATQALQEKFFNKGQVGNQYTQGWLRPLSFSNPTDIKDAYLRWNNGRAGAKKQSKNISNLQIFGGKSGLAPFEVSQANSALRKSKLFQKDFKKVSPALYNLAYDDKSFTNSY